MSVDPEFHAPLKRKLPQFIDYRHLWKHEGLLNTDWHSEGAQPENREITRDPNEATLVGSETILGSHMPVIDLNTHMTWERYTKLLEALYEAGVVQEGFYRMALERGQTFVRYPGVFKKDGEGASG